MRRLRRALAGMLAALLAAPAVYLLAALALGLLPVNPQWRSARDAEGAVLIWLRTNGVHADLVLPARAPHDLSREFAPDVVIDGAREPAPEAFAWIAFGWGDRGFYLNTPRWADLDAKTALRALSAQGPSAMHVEYVRQPEAYAVRPLWVGADEYARLAAYVRAGFRRDEAGAPIRIDHPGYFATDAFYEGVGSYSPLLTSNEWVRRGLAQAGVRTARWAPFDRALLWQADRAVR